MNYVACSVICLQTPRKILLRGLWFGGHKPTKLILWVHGLGSSTFSMLHVVEKLVDSQTAALTFNNRGHDVVNRLSAKTTKKGKPRYGGAAHELFTECVDDINGAVRFARRQGVKEVYLAGHSTGCQKSIYWAAQGGRGVKGIILLAPVSDYAAGIKQFGKRKLERAAQYARALMAKKRKHTLLPSDVWPELLDAQRFLSLYSPDGVEEMFPYAQKGKRPVLLHRVRIPILTLWAGGDEYSTHSGKEVAAWFSQNVLSQKSAVHVIRNAAHNFKKTETETAKIIVDWTSVL